MDQGTDVGSCVPPIPTCMRCKITDSGRPHTGASKASRKDSLTVSTLEHGTTMKAADLQPRSGGKIERLLACGLWGTVFVSRDTSLHIQYGTRNTYLPFKPCFACFKRPLDGIPIQNSLASFQPEP